MQRLVFLVFVVGLIMLAVGLRLRPWALKSEHLLILIGSAALLASTGYYVSKLRRQDAPMLADITAALAAIVAAVFAGYSVYLQALQAVEPTFELAFEDSRVDAILHIEEKSEADACVNPTFTRTIRPFEVANNRNYVITLRNAARVPATSIVMEIELIDKPNTAQVPIYFYAAAVRRPDPSAWVDQSKWTCKTPIRSPRADKAITILIHRLGPREKLEVYSRFVYDPQMVKSSTGPVEFREALRIVVWASGQKTVEPATKVADLKI